MKAKPKVDLPAPAATCPAYYCRGGIEMRIAAEAWGLDKDAYLFNVLKYIVRVGHKESADPVDDLKKALDYLNRRLVLMEAK